MPAGGPCIHWLRRHLLDKMFRCGPVHGQQFRAQCPAHGGKGLNAQFKQQPSGKISFTCYSHGCDLRLLMDAADLVSSDFYPDDQNPLRRRPIGPDPSLDDWCLVTARDNRAKGMTLTEADKRREFEAFKRRRSGIPSPEVS